MTGLTELGQRVVALFNRSYVYARCERCGVFGCPPRDGYAYRCARPTCPGRMSEIDPRSLATLAPMTRFATDI